MKVIIPFYSMYGHIYRMAQAVAEGVDQVAGVEAILRRVPETLPPEVLEKMGAVESQKAMSQVEVCTVEELGEADGIIFGTPTRFGNMCGQMRQFLDAYREIMGDQGPWSAKQVRFLPAQIRSMAARKPLLSRFI